MLMTEILDPDDDPTYLKHSSLDLDEIRPGVYGLKPERPTLSGFFFAECDPRFDKATRLVDEAHFARAFVIGRATLLFCAMAIFALLHAIFGAPF